MANKSVGLLTFNFGANLSGFERAMKKANKTLKKFGKNIEKTGKTLSTGLTLPILGLGVAAVKLASDFEETDSKFKAVFSSIQGEAEETAKTFKDAFGLSQVAAKQLLGDTGDLLVGFGFTESAALDLSKQVNMLAVDLASFTNFQGGAEGASKALTKALVGETESAKALGIVIRQGTAEYKDRVAQIMIEEGVSELQAKALANLEIAYEQSGKAIGDFERTQFSFANQLRVVKGDVSDLAVEFGVILLPMAKDLVNWFKKIVDKLSNMSAATKESIVKWGLLLAAIGPLLVIIGKVSLGFSAIAGILASPKFLAVAPWVAVAGVIATLAVSIYDSVFGLTALEKANETAMRSIASDIVNIEMLTAVLKDENASLDDQKTALDTLKSTYPSFYDEIDEATYSTTALDDATNNLIASLEASAKSQAYHNMIVKLQEEILVAERQAAGLGGTLKLFADAAIDKMNTELRELSGELANLKKSGINLEPKGTKPTHTPTPTFTAPSADIEDHNDEVEKAVALTLAWKKGNEDLKESFELVTANIDEVPESVDSATTAFASFGDELKMIMGGTLEFENMFIETLRNLGDELAQGAESFEEYGQSVKNVMREVIGGLISQGVMMAVSAALKNAMQTGQWWMIPIIAGAAAGLAKTAFNSLVPEFARGGLVTGPTLGLIGEGIGTSASNPEVVAPLDKLKGMMGGSQHVVVTGKIVGNDIYISNEKTSIRRLRTT